MTKPILFVDRDGTILVEPRPSLQLDTFEKLEFLPGAISALSKIQCTLGYELVMVSNQDGLGTDSYPKQDFQGPHELMLRVLGSEGVTFKEILIDPSFPEEDSPNRKPKTGMVEHYRMYPALGESFMVGDRETDMEFAQNLGVGGLFIGEGSKRAQRCFSGWCSVYEFLANRDRVVEHIRKTSETDIFLRLNLDGTGKYAIDTGLKFFDHMLEQLAKHGAMDMDLEVRGDLEVDEHHTIEDVGRVLGEGIARALGDKRGIERYGFVLPMDEVRAEVLLDLSGRPYLEWDAVFHRERVGDVPTEMFQHFFRSFADGSRATLHVKADGKNEHHIIEGIFKAFSRAIRTAVRREKDAPAIPSTKGVL